MKKPRILVVIAIFLALALAVAARAVDPEQPLGFVHALQEHGYGDVAVEYLKMLAERRDLPPQVRDVWDLEMAKSLKAAAKVAFDANEQDALTAESQKYLAKFIKEKADHPEATAAMLSWGEFLATQAMESLYLAKHGDAKDKDRSNKRLAEARTGLLAAADKYRQAKRKLGAQLDALPATSKLPKRVDRNDATRQRLEEELYQCDAQLALIDYNVAQTYPEGKSDERIEALKEATQSLEDVNQRGRGSRIGLNAKLWLGKATAELGDYRTALDILDEVLANEPEPADRSPPSGLESLFAQAERFRLSIIAKQKPQDFLPEAIAWLKGYRRFKQTEGYQGLALDTAQAVLDAAKEASGPERTKLLGEVLPIVAECCKVRSTYQPQLALARREILRLSGRDLTANTFEEARELGDAAADGADWQKAMDAYGRALELADKGKLKDADAIAGVRESMSRVQLAIAGDLLGSGKAKECAAMAAKLVRDDEGNVNTKSAAAAQAAALGVRAAFEVYRTANDSQKPAALEKLMQAAEFTEKNWPDRPAADDARMERGRQKLVSGQVREALDIFERVNPKSERYGASLYMAGQSYWQLYVTEKMKARDSSDDTPEMTANRTKAVERLEGALHILQRQRESGKPLPVYLLETQLLLADIRYHAGEVREAAALYRPLVEALKAESQQTIDATAIRVFVNAMRAYCSLNDLDKAAEISRLLLEQGPDTPQVNEALVACAKLLAADRKKIETRITQRTPSDDARELEAARNRLASVNQALEQTLAGLSRRKISFVETVFVGETLNDIGRTIEGTAVLQNAMKRAQGDADSGHGDEAAMSRLRLQLAKSLRTEGKFDEALAEADQLIRDNPRDLEPLMEKGRILEAWAEKNPAKFDAAVTHWSTIRLRLQGMSRKPEGYYGVYYDVMYHAAYCLVRQAETSQDKSVRMDRAKKAEQVLKSSLVLSPKLNGPETVARYTALLSKAIGLQGRSEPKVEKKGGKTP